jgi:hypothetical protein
MTMTHVSRSAFALVALVVAGSAFACGEIPATVPAVGGDTAAASGDGGFSSSPDGGKTDAADGGAGGGVQQRTRLLLG